MNLSRRDFLLGSAAAGLTLAGAGRVWGQDRLAGQAAGQPGAGAADPQAGPDGGAVELAIARWREDAPEAEFNEAIIRRLTESAIEGLGGMKRFVSRGHEVWIKPNIGWNRKPEFAANTHPVVVATLAKLCLDAGAKRVRVGDLTCNDAKQSYENSGIAPAAREVGADIVYLDPKRFRDMNIGGNRLKEHPVCPEIHESDLVINVPICKHHGATRVSLCMKNYMGVVDKRQVFHQDLPTTIADITQFMKPRLCVLDATRMLVAHGPTGGRLEDVRLKRVVAAGTDIVALDAFGCTLLGHTPEEIETVAMGHQYGLGEIDYRKLGPKELQLS